MRNVLPLVGIGALLFAGIGFGVAAVALPPPPPESLASPPPITEAATTASVFDSPVTAEVVVTVGPQSTVRSPRSGTVTELACPIGTPLSSGTIAFSVDGTPIVAFATSSPLWRDIKVGDQGADVSSLETELEHLRPGTTTSDGRWGRDDDASYRFLLKTLGLNADHSGVQLAELTWIPASAKVTDCPVSVGASVSAGDDVLLLPSSPLGATVRLAQDVDPSTPRVMQVGAEVLPLPSDGIITDTPTLEAIAGSSEFARAEPNAPVTLQFTTKLAAPLEVYAVPPPPPCTKTAPGIRVSATMMAPPKWPPSRPNSA